MHELPMESRAKVELGSGNEDKTGTVVPRAENFGDLTIADHKVLREEGESRNNHRNAVVVQDLATQWLQSFPYKTKTFQKTQKSVHKFLEPTRKPNLARDIYGTVAIRSGQRIVGGFHVMLLLSAKYSGSFLIWWEKLYERRFGMPFNGSLARYISRLCIIRGENLERRHFGRGHWRIGADGRIWTPRPKAQYKGRV